jgi:hypothetical protein
MTQLRMTQLWDAVDALAARAPRLDDLVAHRLHLFAARQLRARGAVVPPAVEQEERAAALRTLAAPALLARVVAAIDAPLIVVKGPEAAAYYPDAALRPYKDVDVIVADAQAAQRALLAAGFEPIETADPAKYEDIHHLHPLRVPDLPLTVELHDRPKWLEGRRAPSAEELFALAVPSRLGVEGVLALPPAGHAVVLAVHSWTHAPLRRALDLVDVAATAAGADAATVARTWGVERLWRTTSRAADAVLGGAPRPLSLRLWARNVAEARDRTVLENHLTRLLSPFWELPPRAALAAGGRALLAELQPEAGESWRTKLRRAGRAISAAKTRVGEHAG